MLYCSHLQPIIVKKKLKDEKLPMQCVLLDRGYIFFIDSKRRVFLIGGLNPSEKY